MQQNLYHNLSYPQGLFNSSSIPTASQFQNNVSCNPPVSSAMYGTTGTTSWAHKVPAFMPWVSEGNNASSTDPVVRFTAPFPPDPCTSQTATSWELLNNLGASKTNANLHLKRRVDLEEPEISPNKQYITEEKMAARMQELHISNQYTIPHENTPFGPYEGDSKSQKQVKSIQELEVMLSCSDKNDGPCKRSIILAPEIKSLVEPEKLFAKTFVHEIERPTMAVVLWKPPHGAVKEIRNAHEENLEQGSTCNDSQNNIISTSAFSSEKNNTSSSQSGPQLTKGGSLPSLPSCFTHMGSSSPNDYDDFEMEA